MAKGQIQVYELSIHILCLYHATRPHATRPPYLLGLLPDLFFGLVRIFCRAGLSSWSDVAGRRFEGAAKKVLWYPVLFWGDVICHFFFSLCGTIHWISVCPICGIVAAPVTGRPFAAHQLLTAKQGSDAGFSLLIQQGKLQETGADELTAHGHSRH